MTFSCNRDKDKQVYIYSAKLTDDYPSLLSLLNEVDKSRYALFNSEHRKKVFVCGRALLSYALNRHANISSYQLDYHALGKPQLANSNNWSFNLSHSGDYLFLILSQRNCGIDCEVIKPRNITRLLCCFDECQQQMILQSKNALHDFYQQWTRKEAVVKYWGKSVFSSQINEEKLIVNTYQFEKVYFSICLDEEILDYHFYFHKF